MKTPFFSVFYFWGNVFFHLWLQEVVRVAESEVQHESSVVFLEVLQQRLVPLHNYTDTFLQTILACIDNKDPGLNHSTTHTPYNNNN